MPPAPQVTTPEQSTQNNTEDDAGLIVPNCASVILRSSTVIETKYLDQEGRALVNKEGRTKRPLTEQEENRLKAIKAKRKKLQQVQQAVQTTKRYLRQRKPVVYFPKGMGT